MYNFEIFVIIAQACEVITSSLKSHFVQSNGKEFGIMQIGT